MSPRAIVSGPRALPRCRGSAPTTPPHSHPQRRTTSRGSRARRVDMQQPRLEIASAGTTRPPRCVGAAATALPHYIAAFPRRATRRIDTMMRASRSCAVTRALKRVSRRARRTAACCRLRRHPPPRPRRTPRTLAAVSLRKSSPASSFEVPASACAHKPASCNGRPPWEPAPRRHCTPARCHAHSRHAAVHKSSRVTHVVACARQPAASNNPSSGECADAAAALPPPTARFSKARTRAACCHTTPLPRHSLRRCAAVAILRRRRHARVSS